MKIAIDISQIVYDTGVSIYTRYLVENLLKVDKRNHYILLGYSLRNFKKLNKFKDQLSEYSNVSFKFYRFPNSVAQLIFNRFRIIPLEKFTREEVDIFHSSDWVQPKIKSEHTKKITTVHDMVVYLFPSSLHPKIVSTQKKRLDHVKKEVDLILADSFATKEDLVKFLEIPQEKIRVIYLAASTEFKPQDDDKIIAILEKYKIKKPYILSVATHEPRKNIQKLLDVFAKIRLERPNFNLVLTGKYGWGEGLHFGEGVVWAGYVTQEDLPAVYSGARVFVYPSLYEGFGLPILEAMAIGCPVITSNNSSMAEIAKDAAILIDPRSDGQFKKAIDLVLDLNLENYQKMVKASLDRARQYTWAKTATETLKAYEEVAEQSS